MHTEQEQLRKRETIARDDETALCNAVGWAKRTERAPGDAAHVVWTPARCWIARLVGPLGCTVHIECERYIDALAFARMVAGANEVEVMGVLGVQAEAVALTDAVRPLRRWQVKWSGSALDPRDQPHMVARRYPYETDFQPAREIDFE